MPGALPVASTFLLLDLSDHSLWPKRRSHRYAEETVRNKSPTPCHAAPANTGCGLGLVLSTRCGVERRDQEAEIVRR